MKNLANCKPSEFLRQTNRIRKQAEKWLTDTDIMNIRKTAPELIPIEKGMSKEEGKEILEENIRKREKQVWTNLSRILDAILEEHPDETLELLALLCFVEPENVDDYPIADYITSISEMLSNEAVIGFFTSLARWGMLSTSK